MSKILDLGKFRVRIEPLEKPIYFSNDCMVCVSASHETSSSNPIIYSGIESHQCFHVGNYSPIPKEFNWDDVDSTGNVHGESLKLFGRDIDRCGECGDVVDRFVIHASVVPRGL